MKFKNRFWKLSIFFVWLVILAGSGAQWCRAMPLGTLLYRTSRDGKMYGYTNDALIDIQQGIMKNIYPGHVGIYVGREDGVDYVVEALADGVVKTPVKQFVNSADGEKFLGAKLPKQLTTLQRSKVVALAKSLAARDLAYDFDFKSQKGPESGQWTCVGLVEKIYESANISNPNNLAALEYDPNYYAVDITPDGFDNQSIFNEDGDCFSRAKEFSKISRRTKMILPLPEIIGFDAGLEYQGERYIFLPYTQFLQPSLQDIVPDIPVASEFSADQERGRPKAGALVLRWSLVNNPDSTLNRVVNAVTDLANQALDKTVQLAKNIGELITGSGSEAKISLNDLSSGTQAALKASSSAPKSKSAKKTGTAANSEIVVNNVPPVKMNINTKAAPSVKSAASKSSAPSKTNSQTKTTASAKATSSSQKTVAKQATSPNKNEPKASNTPTAVIASGGGTAQSNPGPSVSVKVLSPILINRIYSTGDNDWIQLYNPTDSAYDLAANDYRLEKVKAAADPTLMVRIGNAADGAYPGGTIIPAHGYYLLVSAKANAYYRAKAEAIITRDDFSWPGSGYTIYLGSDTISSYNDPDIVDAVGFGPDATYFQGSGPASAITDNYILARSLNQHNNALDFSLVPSDDPALVDFFNLLNYGTSTSTEETASSTDETASSTDETASSTEETGGATSTEETSGATSTDEISTSTDEISTSTEETASSTDLDSGDENEEEEQTAEPDLALISKIYATGDNDWVELFNPMDRDLDLAAANFRLERAKTGSDPEILMRFSEAEDGTYPGGTVIPAGGHYLIVRNEASQYYLNQADAIANRDDFSWTGSGYSVYLGKDSISSSTDPDIVDLVGFGSDATYWQGSAPAPAIPDYSVLRRIGASGQNNLDFEIIASDDPATPTDSDSDSTDAVFTNPFFASQPDLYVPPLPIDSPGLANLWNFDECYGSGSFAVGRWGCARKGGSRNEDLKTTLDEPVDLNNLSLSFYYRQSGDTPSVSVRLSDNDGNYAKLTIVPGEIIVEGLPTDNIYFWLPDIPFDDAWHQATLVVNQTEDYWAVYIDGEEKVYKNFLSRLTTMTEIEVSGNQGPFLIDELAVWNRSLPPSEVEENYQLDRPFLPAFNRAAQLPARLKYFWRFEEDAGAVAIDEMSSTTLNVYPTLWLGRSHDNYAMTVGYKKDMSADLAAPLAAQDLSLTFWWRNAAYPGLGRANISLSNSANSVKLFSFQADNTLQPFWLNNNYGVFSSAFPSDNAWHHIGIVYDSYRYQLTFYLDGEEKASQPFIRFPDNQIINKLIVSTNADGSAIDDLAIWEGALSSQEISNIFSNTR